MCATSSVEQATARGWCPLPACCLSSFGKCVCVSLRFQALQTFFLATHCNTCQQTCQIMTNLHGNLLAALRAQRNLTHTQTQGQPQSLSLCLSPTHTQTCRDTMHLVSLGPSVTHYRSHPSRSNKNSSVCVCVSDLSSNVNKL